MKARGMDIEEGSATIAMISVIAALLFLAALGMLVGSIHSQKARAQAVADLGALAGAGAAPSALLSGQGSAVPCAAARDVVEENGLGLLSCHTECADVLVTVEGQVKGVSRLLPGGLHLEARSRAGPESAGCG